MIAIEALDAEPLHRLSYLGADPGGGRSVAQLRIERARVHGLPDDLDALIATSDLQGIVPDPYTGESTLLGVAVAESLEGLILEGVLPPAERTGVLLAGDLYSVPTADKRGGHGEVRAVWKAFAERFAWVVGVAGNHDDVTAVARIQRAHLLDGDCAEIGGGLRIGGVSLICGDPTRRGRRDETHQLEHIERVAAGGVDVLLLHEGPIGDGPQQRGHPAIRALVEEHAVPLTVCGHDHWEPALARHRRGQILNVDARVVALLRP